MDEDAALSVLEARLVHVFADRSRVKIALTHRSWAHEHAAREGGHGEGPDAYNERLEFFGDSLLGAAAAALLFERFPGAREGELTRRRADLVCERSLAHVAARLQLGALLRLGRGEERSGGREKPRLLASALEAILAAVALDAGVERALTVARGLLEAEVDRAAPGALDFKSRLQEREQAGGRPSPRYELDGANGPEHARIFNVVIRDLDGAVRAQGSGRSKADAEQAAARAMLDEEESEPQERGAR